jgi:hypothetical protein
MGIVEDKIKDLTERRNKILQMGGEKEIAKQREKGKLTARERLGFLFDEGSFREIDMFVTHRCVNFNMNIVDIPSDGVITGHGLIEGRPVFAFAQDFTSRAGSLGEMHAKKICKVMDLALKDILSQFTGIRRNPSDIRHHGSYCRGSGLFSSHDGLCIYGEKQQLYVYHRAGCDQIRHRRGNYL